MTKQHSEAGEEQRQGRYYPTAKAYVALGLPVPVEVLAQDIPEGKRRKR